MKTQRRKRLFAVVIEADRKVEPAFEQFAEMNGWDFCVWDEVEEKKVVFTEYFSNRADARNRIEEINAVVSGDTVHKGMSIRISSVKEQDWSESWKRHFKVIRISDRMIIKPTWENIKIREGQIVIALEPGMSFGTGQHPTTKSCLKMIDKAADKMKGASFLDIGCGSGILAIAGAKLGFKNVTAVDNDPVAVRIAKENFKLNSVSNDVVCRVADLSKGLFQNTYDIVVANILANILIEYAGRIAKAVSRKNDSILILSGILGSQFGGVRKAYARQGFKMISYIKEAEWQSGMFVRM